MINKPIRITLILSFIVFSFAAKAQRGKQTSLSAGTEAIIPINNSYSGSNFSRQTGFGINLKLEKPITSNLHFTVGTGLLLTEANPKYSYLYINPDYSNNPSNTFYGDYYHSLYAYLPVTAGLKYYWAKYFYINADAGGAFSINNRARTSFIYLGGVGAVVPIGRHHGLDFGLQYERGYKNTDYNHTISQLGLNVAYKYRF